MKLLLQAFIKALSGFLLMGFLLFYPAGTFNYPSAWLLMGILFIPMIIVGVYLCLKNPELLKKRMNTKESEKEQVVVIMLCSILFVICFIVCALDFRYQISKFPLWLTIVSVILFILSFLIYFEVLRENTYLSRTVEIQENQKVISTGLYGIVRHPMYFACVLLFTSMPLVLGSFLGLLVMLPIPLVLLKRIKNEEKVLIEGLEGYKEYTKKVRYRLIPFIW
ncbi:MAG: isoprenylcysteine carboxylmethyltransferase family protein [Erysipelotrichaceae bacterium]|nr:isoprenylcysteine carboxylmethyltransferase family protein [Erysipelotrichaceae bacterium]